MATKTRNKILEVLKQHYTHTCVIFPNLNRIYFYEQNALRVEFPAFVVDKSPDYVSARCVVNKSKMEFRLLGNDDSGSSEDVRQGDIEINDFMTEIYRIHQKFKRDRDEYDGLILKAFSMTLKKVHKTLSNSNPITGVKQYHYIFVVPTEWEPKIRDKIIRPIFNEAGFINDIDHPCRLLFYTKLDALIFGLQNGSFRLIVDITPTRNNVVLERGKRYTLCDLHVKEKEVSIKRYSFDTIQTYGRLDSKRDIFIMDPDSVRSSKFYPLLSLNTIRVNMMKLLQEKGALLPTVNIEEKKGNFRSLLDDLIREVLVKSSKKILEEERESIQDKNKVKDEMLFQSISKNWKFNSYDYYKLILPERVRLISMTEAYTAVIRGNQTSIEKLLEDESINEREKTIESIFLAVDKEQIDYSGHNYYADETQQSNYGDLDCYDDDEEDNRYFTNNFSEHNKVDNTEEDQNRKYDDFHLEENDNALPLNPDGETDLSLLYFRCIYNLLYKLGRRFFSDDNNAIRHHPFLYDSSDLKRKILEKFANSSKSFIKFLPPSIVRAPEEDYLSPQPHFTIKSNPVYIVKTDIALYEPSTFSCVQLEPGNKGAIKSILFGEEINDLNSNDTCLPPLFLFFDFDTANQFISTESLWITENMLRIMESHFESAIKYFAKYNRHLRKKSSLHPYQAESLKLQANKIDAEKLNAKDEITLKAEHCLLPSKRIFEALVPQIKSELENKTKEKVNLVEIKKQSLKITFIMIYLGILKHKIDTFVNKKIITETIDSNKIIGYTLGVNAILFEKILRGSYSIMKELSIASGFAKDGLDFKKNVRIITEREEQLLPILQRKSSANLPLKSFYAHARLYERYIHLSLNQVVMEDETPDINAKNIVIKSKTVTSLGNLHDLVCNNFWVGVHPNEYLLADTLCKRHNKSYSQSQEFSMDELDVFKKKLAFVIKELFSKEEEDLTKEVISIPVSNSCNCKLHFEYKDIVELGFVPAIENIVSVITGAITNLDVFGMYAIEHIFVNFNYFTSTFHRSYEELIEYNLRRTIDISLKKKRMKIPYTLFSESSGGIMKPMSKEKFILADSFSFGNLLQTPSETYIFKFQMIKGSYDEKFVDCEIYINNQDHEHCFRKKCEEEIFLKSFDVLPCGGTRRVFYAKLNQTVDPKTTVFELEITILPRSYTYNDGHSSINYIQYSDKEASKKDLMGSIVVECKLWHCSSIIELFDGDVYMPLYAYIKPLNFDSLIKVSLQAGAGLFQKETIEEPPSSFNLADRLTLMQTQY